MKICWDNLEKIKYSKKTGNFYNLSGKLTYDYKESCNYCKEPFLTLKFQKKKNSGFCSISCGKSGKNNPNKDPQVTKKANETRKKNNTFTSGNKNGMWSGGYRKRNLAPYDTYSERLYSEKCRRHPKDKNLLQVKCTYCGKWYTPSLSSVRHRINILEGIENLGELRLYCSNGCKQSCPVYKKAKWPKGFKISTSREVQPELRQLVFERDNYTCQKCSSIKSLHCHHLEGIRWEPLESADIDKCITLCKSCHKKAHKIPDCSYYDLQCKE